MSAETNAAAKTPDRFVLDSFALLAYLQDEAGAAEVQRILLAARDKEAVVSMSVINLGEAAYITEREQSVEAVHSTLAAVEQLPVEVVAADRQLTLDAAHVKARHSISYADAFAVSLARSRNARVVTGDPEFSKVSDLVPVHWLDR